MNQKHLNTVLEKLNLGQPIKPLKKIPGGPGGGHQLWKLSTDKSEYCIKQLAAATNLKDSKVISRYELCESIASRFAQHGIPAVYALECSGQHLIIIDNTAYLAYPWIEGYALGRREVSRSHAIKIAELLASIHKIDLQAPEIAQKFDKFTKESLQDAFNQAISLNLPFGLEIKENQPMIFSLNDIYLEAIPILSEASVLTHGDVNQTNVIWKDKNKPFLIDWEAIKKMNPTQEILRSSLGWGIPSESTSFEIFMSMISSYKDSGGPFNKNHVAAAVKSIFGNQIFWLMYNIKLACEANSVNKKDKACNEITDVLKSMKKLKDGFHDLIKISMY